MKIRNRYTREVILEVNPNGDDLCNVDLRNTDLRNADLYKANLIGASLMDVDLYMANLRDADFRGANFRGANLEDVNLEGANLEGANLEGANLNKTKLSWCIGNMREIKSMQLDSYMITFTKDSMAIGCQQYGIKHWKNFTDADIDKMDIRALNWCKKWKDFILQAIELSFKGE